MFAPPPDFSGLKFIYSEKATKFCEISTLTTIQGQGHDFIDMSLIETRKELDPELENGLKEMQNMDFPNASCGSNPRNIRKTVPNKKKFHNCTLCVLSFSRNLT